MSLGASAEFPAEPTADNLSEWANGLAWQRNELLSIYEEELYQWLDEHGTTAMGTGAYPKDWYNKVLKNWAQGIELIAESRQLVESANRKFRSNHAQCKEKLDFYIDNHYPDLVASYEEFKQLPSMLAENPYTPIFWPYGTLELAAYLDTAILTCTL